MKKVVFVGTGFHPIPPVKGAAVETWIAEIAKRMFSYEPHIISPYHPGLPLVELVNGVRYHRIKMGCLYSRFFKKITRLDPYPFEDRVVDIIIKINPEIVHINNRYWLVPMIRKKMGTRLKIILHMHNDFKLTTDINLDIDKLAGCSNFMKELAAKKINIDPRKCSTIKNGIDMEKYKPVWVKPKRRGEVRKKYGVEKDKVVLFVGRVSPEKGIDLLIKAFDLVQKRISEAKLVIVGEIRKGKRKDCNREEFGRKVMSMARPFGKRIIFTDLISPNEIHDYYLLGDVFAATPIKEAFGKVFLEASASGLPIVTTNVGGVSEAFNNGSSGFLVEYPDDYKKVAEYIVLLLKSSTKAREMGENGVEWVGKRFNWDKIVKEVEQLYDSL